LDDKQCGNAKNGLFCFKTNPAIFCFYAKNSAPINSNPSISDPSIECGGIVGDTLITKNYKNYNSSDARCPDIQKAITTLFIIIVRF